MDHKSEINYYYYHYYQMLKKSTILCNYSFVAFIKFFQRHLFFYIKDCTLSEALELLEETCCYRTLKVLIKRFRDLESHSSRPEIFKTKFHKYDSTDDSRD